MTTFQMALYSLALVMVSGSLGATVMAFFASSDDR